jgi:hypothetical protein
MAMMIGIKPQMVRSVSMSLKERWRKKSSLVSILLHSLAQLHIEIPEHRSHHLNGSSPTYVVIPAPPVCQKMASAIEIPHFHSCSLIGPVSLWCSYHHA